MNNAIKLKEWCRQKTGASTVFFAVALAAITVCAALTVDVGVMALEKSKLSSAIDAAALAGAQELAASGENIQDVVENYVAKNIGTLKSLDVSTDTGSKTVAVKGVKTVDYSFAAVLGQRTGDITADAEARVEIIKSLKGVRPLAIVSQTFTYGQLYTLKEGAGDGIHGNYAAIALGSTGASNYRDNLLNGYDGTVSVGDVILTETGNISGTTQTCINQLLDDCVHTPACTHTSYNKSCSRIIFVPIVDTLQINGRDYVKVVGFATFFLEGVTRHSGHADVIGRFISYLANGETATDIDDYGTYGIRLVK